MSVLIGSTRPLLFFRFNEIPNAPRSSSSNDRRVSDENVLPTGDFSGATTSIVFGCSKGSIGIGSGGGPFSDRRL